MKFGVKTYADAKFVDYFKDKADFLEIMAIPEKDYSFLEGYPLPIVIHAMHDAFGVNVADPDLMEKNMVSINFAIELADSLNSKKIILHPGLLRKENDSAGHAIKFFKDLDERIIFENMPPQGGFLCSAFNDSEKFGFETKKGICFDINHALQTAMVSNIDLIYIVKDFLKLKPSHYHLSGQNGSAESETHLCFEDSTIPTGEILNLIPQDAEVTLEVTTDIATTVKDLEFVRSLVA